MSDKLPPQQLTISANDLSHLKKRLNKRGIETSPFVQDPYTGRRTLYFSGPDNVTITVIED